MSQDIHGRSAGAYESDRHHPGMARKFPPDERFGLRIWSADAVVLYDWLMSLDFDRLPVSHKAEKQALVDLLTALESQTPVLGVTQQEIDRARFEVSRDMGWG